MRPYAIDRIRAQLQTQGRLLGVQGDINGAGRFDRVAFLCAVHGMRKISGSANHVTISLELRHVFQSGAGEVGAELTWFDDHDFDAERRDFQGERFR